MRSGRLALGFILACLTVMLVGDHVQAAPNQGPDPANFSESNVYGNDWAGWGRRVDYVVATSIYNYIPTTRVKIFLPTPTGQVTIHNKDICYGTFRNNGNNYDTPDDGNRLGSSGPAVSYDIPGSGGVIHWGWWDGSATCDNNSVTLSLSGASRDPNTNMYLYVLTATANPSAARYMNTFWLTGPAGSIISQDSSLSATSGFGMNQAYPMINGNNPSSTQFPPAPYRNYTNWSIRFAPDCTVTTPTVSRTIETYDDDNLTASPSDNWAVQPRRFSVQLQEYNRAGVFQGALTPTSIGFPDGGGGYNTGGNGIYEIYTSGSNKRIQLTYTFRRDMVYRWEIYNVYIDNTLQFRVPFDNVYYYRECALPKARLRAAMSATPTGIMQSDQTARFSPSLIVSNYSGLPVTVNCNIRRTSYPPTGGSVNLGNQPCTTPAGDPNIQINSGASPVALRENTYNSPGAVAGTRVCDLMTITNPSDPAYFASPSDNQAEACVVIGKTPYVHFMGGDVWAGGGILRQTGSCSNDLSKITTLSRDLGGANGYAGSTVEYAAFALGAISQFGSGSRALVTGAPAGPTALARALTFSNTSPTLGNFAASPRCINTHYWEMADVTQPCGAVVNVNAPPSTPCRRVGDLTINAGTLPPGSKQLYVVEGQVFITGNVNYPSNYSSINDLPSLVVIALNDIQVSSSVRTMDGIFFTNGTLFTCQGKPPLPAPACNQDLVINGAVIANRVDLYRTAGAEGSSAAQRKVPSEIFKLSPEVFLKNALNNNNSQTVITTSDTRELPPRF